MADKLQVIVNSTLLHTGKGQLTGFQISTAVSPGPAQIIFFDNTVNGGTYLLQIYVWPGDPVTVFFPERLAPTFATGLYATLAANLTCSVWYRTV